MGGLVELPGLACSAGGRNRRNVLTAVCVGVGAGMDGCGTGVCAKRSRRTRCSPESSNPGPEHGGKRSKLSTLGVRKYVRSYCQRLATYSCGADVPEGFPVGETFEALETQIDEGYGFEARLWGPGSPRGRGTIAVRGIGAWNDPIRAPCGMAAPALTILGCCVVESAGLMGTEKQISRNRCVHSVNTRGTACSDREMSCYGPVRSSVSLLFGRWVGKLAGVADLPSGHPHCLWGALHQLLAAWDNQSSE